MSLPELPTNASRHQMRKALIQMRLELHRQELRQEALQALQPLQEVRDFGRRCKSALGHGALPVAGIAALAVSGLLLSQRRQWPRYWLVDPLDGTREFVKRNGEFTVNIALIDGERSVLGVVQVPVSGVIAWAWQGGGAWMARAEAAPGRCRTRRRAQPLVVAGSRSHGDPRLLGMLERVGVHEIIPLGSSLKFLRIAAAEADLYVRLGPTSEWDTAAAQCVLEEAGGAVIDLHGNPLRYNRKESLLNPEFIACGDAQVDWPELLGGT